MLTRIEIDGFKTFKDFALDVPPFLVVLGQNASGKSNLFDAVAFLARLAEGASAMDAVRADRARLHELLHHDAEGRRGDRIRFAVELGQLGLDDGAGVRYELDLEVRSKDATDPAGTERLVITDERWFLLPSATGPEGPRPLPYLPVPEDETEFGMTPGGFPATKAFRASVVQTAEGQRLDRQLNTVIGAVRKELASWRVLALEPSALRAANDYNDEDHLAPSGANLPNTLARILRGTRSEDYPRGLLTQIRNDLATVIPDVLDIDLDDARSLRLRSIMVTTKGEGRFTAQVASDGTLRALALVTVLNDPDDVGLLCVEEPENGVYPQRLHRLVTLLSRATGAGTGRQVLVSSHSPAVLRALPPVQGRALRQDVVLLTSASRTTGEPGTRHRVSTVRPLRADPAVPLPDDLPGPVMSLGEIEEFLGAGAVGRPGRRGPPGAGIARSGGIGGPGHGPGPPGGRLPDDRRPP